jgi:hypothetical protein
MTRKESFFELPHDVFHFLIRKIKQFLSSPAFTNKKLECDILTINLSTIYIVQIKNHTYSRIAILAISSLVVFLIANLFGEIIGLAANSDCYPYIGCTSGFFGYDAIEHFLFGLTVIWIIVWACGKFPKYSILHKERWKKRFVLIASIALIAVFWEFLECAHDAFRLDILGEHLYNFRFHINLLDQPSNLDTMGDLAFTLLGAFVALFFI